MGRVDLLAEQGRRDAQYCIVLIAKRHQIPLHLLHKLLSDQDTVALITKAGPLPSRTTLSGLAASGVEDIRRRFITSVFGKKPAVTLMVDETSDRFGRKPVVLVVACYCTDDGILVDRLVHASVRSCMLV